MDNSMMGKSGLPRLSGDYNKGYTQAIKDITDIIEYVSIDMKEHHRVLTLKYIQSLMRCILDSRSALRENIFCYNTRFFIRYNGKSNKFECFDSSKREVVNTK